VEIDSQKHPLGGFMKKLILLISLMLMATAALAETTPPQPKVNLRQGNPNQTVFAGETIEPVVFVVKGADAVEFTLIDGLSGSVEHDDWTNDDLATISGTIDKDTDPGQYEMEILAKDTKNNTSLRSRFHITVIDRADAFVHSSGKLEQTVTGGEPIEPIVFDYKRLLKFDIVDELPPGLIASSDGSSKLTIEGTIPTARRDNEYTYKLVAYMTEQDFVVYDCKLKVNHTPARTTIKALANDSQDVVAGDNIKPIRLKYENITDLNFKDIPSSLNTFNNTDAKEILIQGPIPEDYGDMTIVMYVYAKGLDNNDSAKITFNIKHKPSVTKMEHASGDIEQTVNAGDSIKPIVFKYENAKNAKGSGFPEGTLEIVRDTKAKTFTIQGAVSEKASGEYNLKIIAEGYDNDDMATVKITVLQPDVDLKIVENESQDVTAGDKIKNIVVEYKNAQEVNVGHLIPTLKYDKVTGEDKLIISGYIPEDYEDQTITLVINATGSNNSTDVVNATTKVKHKSAVTAIQLTSDNAEQTVTAGESIKPIIYKLEHVKNIDVKGVPKGIKAEPDNDAKTLTVFGTVSPTAGAGDYVFTIIVEGTDNNATATGTITVTKPTSSASVSSSSIATSSSSKPPVSSSSIKQSSDSKSSSSQAPASSSSAVKASSSSEAKNSSSSTVKSSDSKSSSSQVPASSSSTGKSSSSVTKSSDSKLSSSQAPASSSSAVKASSSSEAKNSSSSTVKSSVSKSSSSSKKEQTIPYVQDLKIASWSIEANTLSVATKNPATLQITDLMGNLVESVDVKTYASINLGHLPRGIYLVRIAGDSLKKASRIMIK
jgi:hypothetical protein